MYIVDAMKFNLLFINTRNSVIQNNSNTASKILDVSLRNYLVRMYK